MLPSLRLPTLLGACCGLLVTAVPAPAQFNTPTINGTPDNPAGEYGSTVLGENHVVAVSDQGWYVTWDADYLYIGITQANLAEGAVIYVDWNPIVPVTGGTNADGSVEGQEYDGLRFARLPFRADFVAYFKSGYHEFRQANGANGWGGNVANTWLYAENGGNNSREVRIPWDDITAGNGRPASFNWFGYLTGASAQVYGSVPTARDPFSGGTFARDPWYLTVDSTADGSSTFPFQLNSYTYVENFNNVLGQPLLTHGTFADLTVNRPNIQLMRSEDPVFTQLRDLIVGDGEFHFGTSPSFLEVTRDVHLVGGQLTLGTQVGGDLRVGRDFRISPGGVLQGNDRQVEFFGTQSGVIEGEFTGNNHIDYMRMNKTSGAEMLLEGNLEVSVRLWLTIGALDTNGNLLRILFSGADSPNTGVLRGVSDAGYVRGTLQRRIGMVQGIRQFPVGTNPAAPLFIDFGQSGPSQIGEIAVSTTEELITPFSADTMIARTWQVDIVQPLGTYEAALEFQYDAGDIDGAVVEADLRAAKRYSAGSFHAHASTWLDPQTAVRTDGFTASDTSINQSLDGLWVLTTAPDSLLRVNLVEFAAECEGVGSPVTIEWETAAEFLNAGFNVYRVADDDTLRRINGFPIPAQGTETRGAVYAFVDPDAMHPGEVRAYALEDVEFSGRKTLHGPVTVGPLGAAASAVEDWALFGW